MMVGTQTRNPILRGVYTVYFINFFLKLIQNNQLVYNITF